MQSTQSTPLILLSQRIFVKNKKINKIAFRRYSSLNIHRGLLINVCMFWHTVLHSLGIDVQTGSIRMWESDISITFLNNTKKNKEKNDLEYFKTKVITQCRFVVLIYLLHTTSGGA